MLELNQYSTSTITDMFYKMNWLLVCLRFVTMATSVSAYIYTNENGGLTELPNDIPSNTQNLRLSKNNLAGADFSGLAGFSINSITMTLNGFTEFPDLEVLGATLAWLNLGKNNIASMAVDRLDGLVDLGYLQLNYNSMTTFPDLSPVAGTLNWFVLTYNPLEEVMITPGAYVMTKLELTMSKGDDVLRALNISPLAGSLLLLMMNQMRLGSLLENALPNFSKLEKLDFTSSKATAFPDLSTSCDELTEVLFSYNEIPYIDDTYIESCKKITKFAAKYNLITNFPNLSQSGAVLTILKD